MRVDTLAAALEREHRDIDAGIEQFTAEPAGGDRDTEPLLRAIAALRRHIYLEEEFLFPPLAAAGLVAPIFVMLREHGQLWTTLDQLHATLNAGSETTGGASAPALCHQLIVQLAHHNLKEERVLYAQADEVLTAEATEQLTGFLATSELPDGWVCEKARR